MKPILLFMIAVLMMANVAVADHISIYSDETGANCNLAPGFSTTATIIHKFTLGATGSRFRVDLSLAPGSAVFAFNTPFISIGSLENDISIGYGNCYTGTIVLGTIVAFWSPGAVSVVPAIGFPNIIYTDCAFAERFATGGHASVSGDGHGCDYDPVQSSTWGKVKALYRD